MVDGVVGTVGFFLLFILLWRNFGNSVGKASQAVDAGGETCRVRPELQ